MSERHVALFERYNKVVGVDEPLPCALGDSYLNENDYLLLQSFVLAVNWRDASMADSAITQLMPRLKALHSMLFIDIVEALYAGDYDLV